MKSTLVCGLVHQSSLEVDESLTVPQVNEKLKAFSDMPAVFATAYMVAFIESTCIEAISSHLDDGEHSVGTYVDVSHIAATPPGMTVTAEVELIAIDKRMLTFKVSARDNKGLIGEGTHRRAIIDVERFMEKVEQKQPA